MAKKKIIPRVVRLNNPGALKGKIWNYYYNSETQDVEMFPSQKDEKKYNIYRTQEEGVIAQGLNLLRYNAAGRNTITSILMKYASPTDGNDTQRYIKDLTNEVNALRKKAGMPPITKDTKLDLTDETTLFMVASSMTKLEGAKGAYSEEVFRSGLSKALAFHKAEKAAQNGDNPFYCEEPTSVLSGDANKYHQLKSEVICSLSETESITLWDVGKAVHDGKITFEQAVLLRHIAQHTEDKSLKGIRAAIRSSEWKSKLHTDDKKIDAALSAVIQNTQPQQTQTIQEENQTENKSQPVSSQNKGKQASNNQTLMRYAQVYVESNAPDMPALQQERMG